MLMAVDGLVKLSERLLGLGEVAEILLAGDRLLNQKDIG
jgi:hypothetical protein